MNIFFTILKDESFEASNLKKQTTKKYTRNQSSQGKNSALELEKYFKPITVSVDEMDRFEEKEIMKKKITAKNLWYN